MSKRAPQDCQPPPSIPAKPFSKAQKPPQGRRGMPHQSVAIRLKGRKIGRTRRKIKRQSLAFRRVWLVPSARGGLLQTEFRERNPLAEQFGGFAGIRRPLARPQAAEM